MGLRKWVQEKWVDIGAPKKNGKYQPCGRSKGSKRAYPKCVPLAKATRMTSSQKASAVKRKRAAQNTGPKPTNVKTIIKRTKKSDGGYIGKL
jgi:ABC-type phosphate transport system substrate-binding protein